MSLHSGQNCTRSATNRRPKSRRTRNSGIATGSTEFMSSAVSPPCRKWRQEVGTAREVLLLFIRDVALVIL
eukprot:scaffold12711_cov120-Isochrysis_galbana.AAC.10